MSTPALPSPTTYRLPARGKILRWVGVATLASATTVLLLPATVASAASETLKGPAAVASTPPTMFGSPVTFISATDDFQYAMAPGNASGFTSRTERISR